MPVWHLWMAEVKATSSSEQGGCGIHCLVLGQIPPPTCPTMQPLCLAPPPGLPKASEHYEFRELKQGAECPPKSPGRGEDTQAGSPLCQDGMRGRTLHHPTLRNELSSCPSWPRHRSRTSSAGPGVEGDGISLHLPAFHPVRGMPTVRVHRRQENGFQDHLRCLSGGPPHRLLARLNTPSPCTGALGSNPS